MRLNLPLAIGSICGLRHHLDMLMLKPKMVDKLNAQINLEFYSSNLYLQMSAWCEEKSFAGAAKFMQSQAAEEMDHMNRLFRYVSETGSLPIVGAIDAPPHKFKSLRELIKATYEHERMITEKINALAHEAFTSQDYSTFNFLQWYVAEQHEEETLFKSILDKIDLVGDDGHALFFIDKDLGEMANQAAAAQAMETPPE